MSDSRKSKPKGAPNGGWFKHRPHLNHLILTSPPNSTKLPHEQGNLGEKRHSLLILLVLLSENSVPTPLERQPRIEIQGPSGGHGTARRGKTPNNEH